MAGYAHFYAEEKHCGYHEFFNLSIIEQDMNVAHLMVLGELRKREQDKKHG